MRDRVPRLLPATIGALLLLAAPAAATTPSTPSPTVSTASACYRVGQRVAVTGAGFAPSRPYDIAIDGVDFGQSETTATGSFAVTLVPGGLPAGVTQTIDRLDASDGSSDATTAFTLTRATGALFTPSQGTPERRGRFEAWDMGPGTTIYLHYVRGRSRSAARTVKLGAATGACGAMRSATRPLFPFRPRNGAWTLQLDTHATYAPHPTGTVARLRITVA